MGCFGSTDTWRADGMLLTLNTLLYYDQDQNDYQGYKPLLETTLTIYRLGDFRVQHNTTFVLNHIICEATNTSSVKCLISKARKMQEVLKIK
jgi:hypothetical protein